MLHAAQLCDCKRPPAGAATLTGRRFVYRYSLAELEIALRLLRTAVELRLRLDPGAARELGAESRLHLRAGARIDRARQELLFGPELRPTPRLDQELGLLRSPGGPGGGGNSGSHASGGGEAQRLKGPQAESGKHRQQQQLEKTSLDHDEDDGDDNDGCDEDDEASDSSSSIGSLSSPDPADAEDSAGGSLDSSGVSSVGIETDSSTAGDAEPRFEASARTVACSLPGGSWHCGDAFHTSMHEFTHPHPIQHVHRRTLVHTLAFLSPHEHADPNVLPVRAAAKRPVLNFRVRDPGQELRTFEHRARRCVAVLVEALPGIPVTENIDGLVGCPEPHP